MAPCPAEVSVVAAFRYLHAHHLPKIPPPPKALGSTWHGLVRSFNPTTRGKQGMGQLSKRCPLNRGLMATVLTSHRYRSQPMPKQAAMGWYCCSRLPVLSETPDGQGPRCLNICCRCKRRLKLVERLGVSFSRQRASSHGPCSIMANDSSLTALQSALNSSTPSFSPQPLLLFYLNSFYSRKLCSGKFNGLN